MSFSIEEILTEYPLHTPASSEDITKAEAALGHSLPSDYREFLLRSNGGEGFIGSHYLVLWQAEELAIFNADYQVQECAPGFLLFGADGGGEGLAFDTRTAPFPVVQLPFVGLGLEDGLPVAESFTHLILRMREVESSLFPTR